ncbi:YceI family protein [Sphingobacterium corticibacterium]|uniref:YceI family protein n=1 Tax=Sphingobacterium corticibacterium TaxID=2484746 RepID=A0A4Q6XPP1_9SPHI|nr:YceI family protein [Sphingobacterium corticibacterium]RZF61881.1 YceI family protein [Sphingobacterium corticibacterium]
MRKIFLSMAVGTAILFASCGGNSSKTQVSEKQEVAEKQGDVYTANLEASEVNWKATHKGGLAPRWGILSVTSGELTVADGNVNAGDFTIDMKSLEVDAASVTEADKKAIDLQNHLKSEDFFDVENHATATFHITQVSDLDLSTVNNTVNGANKLVSGNLTLLDSTLNISFPAKIDVQENKVAVEAKFTVNRVDWGIKFGTSELDPAEWGISRDIEVGVNLEATKQ